MYIPTNNFSHSVYLKPCYLALIVNQIAVIIYNPLLSLITDQM